MASSPCRERPGRCGRSSGGCPEPPRASKPSLERSLEAEREADRAAPEIEVAEVEIARVDDDPVGARLALEAAEVADVAAQADVAVEVADEAAARVEGEVVPAHGVEEVAGAGDGRTHEPGPARDERRDARRL